MCRCGECVCTEAFLGDNCGQKNCTVGRKECTKNGVICGGNGVCECDVCRCKVGCSGRFCETCLSQGKCQQHAPCVKCHFTGDHAACEKCDEVTKNNDVIIQNVTYVAAGNETSRGWGCGNKTDDLCVLLLPDEVGEVYYKVVTIEGHITVTMALCPFPVQPFPMWAVFLLIAGLVGIGVGLLVVWKITVTLYDRREYEKFLLNTRYPQFGPTQSPIYQTPISSVKNPTYGKKSLTSDSSMEIVSSFMI